MVKRPVPPGMKGKRRKGAPSEYAKQLAEKQKIKRWYGLREKQFKKYVRGVLEKSRRRKSKEKVDASQVLTGILESRLDNVIFRLGLVNSRAFARQLVSHGYFLVNNRPVDIPSFLVKKGDIVKIKPEKLKKKVFQNLPQQLKKQRLPDWLQFNPQNFEAKVVALPALGGETLPGEIPTIFEFYSR